MLIDTKLNQHQTEKPEPSETRKKLVPEIVAQAVLALSHRKTQKQLAAEMGFKHVNTLSMVKHGKTPLPYIRLDAFARVLEIDFGYLVRCWIEDGETQEAIALGKAFEDCGFTVLSTNELEILEWYRAGMKP